MQSASGATIVLGEAGDDTLTADTLPTLRTPRNRPDDGIAGAVRDTVDLDGGADSDIYIVNVTGAGDYLVNIRDRGAVGTDNLTVNGTEQADHFLLRASQNPNGIAFAAALHGDPVADVERVNYDKALEGLVLDTRGGDDRAALDDNWTKTTLLGGLGKDRFQVGQIFKSERDAAAGVANGDEFETEESTRGFLS